MPPQNIYDTPQKAKVQGAYEFLAAKGIPHNEREIFDFFGVKQLLGYDMIQAGAPTRTRKNQDVNEIRGRKRKLTGADVAETDHLLEERELDIEAKAMPWGAITWTLDLDILAQTLRQTIKEAIGYSKNLSALKEDLPERTKKHRVEWAGPIKAERPHRQHWHNVRFSDEVYAGYRPKGHFCIARKRGKAMRYRIDNVQHRAPPPKKGQDHPRVHGSAAIRYDFKSDLVPYKVPTNKNGKLSYKAYIEQILEPVVRPWLERGDDFVLEEDGDSGCGGGPKARKNNPVAKWKRDIGLKTYFNCHDSPDLTPIENCWSAPKAYVQKRPHWDEQSLWELLLEGWAQVSIEFINEQVDSMPQRLHDVLEGGGKRTAW